MLLFLQLPILQQLELFLSKITPVHHCGNCPAAAIVLDTIISDYGKQVVPLNVQAGGFATYFTAPYTTDFTTSAGTDWDNTFGISAIANPAGIVDRQSGPPHGFWHSTGSWADSVQIFYCNQTTSTLKLKMSIVLQKDQSQQP